MSHLPWNPYWPDLPPSREEITERVARVAANKVRQLKPGEEFTIRRSDQTHEMFRLTVRSGERQSRLARWRTWLKRVGR